jgi:hypothetical protein
MLSERLDGLFSMSERAKTPPGLLRAGDVPAAINRRWTCGRATRSG